MCSLGSWVSALAQGEKVSDRGRERNRQREIGKEGGREDGGAAEKAVAAVFAVVPGGLDASPDERQAARWNLPNQAGKPTAAQRGREGWMERTKREVGRRGRERDGYKETIRIEQRASSLDTPSLKSIGALRTPR